jgi:K+-transporting ATPase ATPase A chain
MTLNDVAQFVIVLLGLALTVPFLGNYMARVYTGAPSRLDRVYSPVERLAYRITGVDELADQTWRGYAVSVLAFSGVSVLAVYGIERLQHFFPLNPSHAGSVSPALAWNTAVSFVTNTNWQNYAGETTMSLFTQMAALTVQNFLSAAVGIAIAVALIRGLVRSRSNGVGNFWVDLTRSVVRVLLPIAVLATLVLVSNGVMQNLNAPEAIHTLAGGHQTLYNGAVASQEAIKELGTNGGGIGNANAALPYENPNGFTNLFEIWLMLVIPFSLAWTFGKMVGNRRQGLAILSAMVVLWAGSAAAAMALESQGNALLGSAVNQSASATNIGGNLTGKELRFGAAPSALYNTSATATSTGSIDSASDSYTALGGGVLLVNMMLGEVTPGGVGSGLYGMLMLAILSVFLAGLMVGRTPEYLGKKIQAAEMKLVALYVLLVPFVALCATAIALLNAGARASLLNHGAHGLTEMLYAFVSTSNNNGSAFAGLNGNTTFFDTVLGICMLLGRFALIVPVLAIAGSLGRKTRIPVSAGTLPTDTALFATMLTGVTVVVVGLTYFPVVTLGPLVEHFVTHA